MFKQAHGRPQPEVFANIAYVAADQRVIWREAEIDGGTSGENQSKLKTVFWWSDSSGRLHGLGCGDPCRLPKSSSGCGDAVHIRRIKIWAGVELGSLVRVDALQPIRGSQARWRVAHASRLGTEKKPGLNVPLVNSRAYRSATFLRCSELSGWLRARRPGRQAFRWRVPSRGRE